MKLLMLVLLLFVCVCVCACVRACVCVCVCREGGREGAAHPAVSSLGTRCKLMPTVHVSPHVVGEGPGESSGVHTFTCETSHSPPAGYQYCPRRIYLH